ncbi:transcription initiation protein [Flavobacterium album]|uniref:Transcription initiation protein n=1 Tax=Flavobacterium album TaxID=2175091 RepID=A0A2S1QVY7_9FLAO|nr:YciI family protein [Flavobacterium album]AWH84546.1 transcription initiation protein [Flavobacterium album]
MKDFVLIFRSNDDPAQRPSPEQMQQAFAKWMDWMAGIAAQNKMVDRGNRLSPANVKVVAPGNVVTDGPYTEIKEFISGYTIIKSHTIDEAVEIAKGCPIFEFGGRVEVRAVIAPDDND